MKIEQSEALRLADLLDSVDIDAIWPEGDLWAKIGGVDLDAAAAELRRLHALNAELLEALKFYLTSWDGGEVEWFKNCYDVEYKVRVAISKAEEQE